MQNIPYVRTAADLERKYNLSALPTIEKNTKTNQEQILKTNKMLEEFTVETIKNLENLQDQVDGNVTTYYYSGVPTLLNPPVSDWKEEEYNVHLGDLYYDKDTGYAYRFYLDTEPNVYGWVRITDSDITEALAIANTAKDTADAKRRVFVVEPKPPYDVGDIWFKEDKDLFRCKLGRQKGDSFNNSDWILATNYTDDTAANEAKAELSDYKLYVETTYETQADFIKEKEALELKVSKVETVANDKNKVFTNEPTTPYLPGDVYIKETTVEGMKQNLIYVCQTGRKSGDYNPNDFSLQPSYASQSDLKLTDDKIAAVVQSVEDLEKEVTTIKETSGNNSLYVEDALESRVLEYGIDGKSEQDGTPTPDTPVEIKSVDGVRNLLKTTNWSSYTITSTGETTVSSDRMSTDYIEVKPNETYIYSSSIENNFYGIAYYDSSKTFLSRTYKNGGKSITVTIPENTKYIRVFAQPVMNVAFTQGKFEEYQLMLNKGSVTHSYVPYGNWLIVQTTGKNLFDINNQYKVGQSFTYNGITITYNENGYITLNGTASASGDINIVPKGYTITLDKDIYLCLEKASGSISVDKGFTCQAINKSGESIWTYAAKESAPIKKVPYSDIVSIGWLRIQITSGIVFTNYKIRCWVSTENSLDFEPYKENISLIGMNKPNLFDKDNPNLVNLFPGSTSFGYNANYKSLYIEIEPNTTYTIHRSVYNNADIDIGTSPDIPVENGVVTNKKDSSTNIPLTITSGANDKYLTIYYCWTATNEEEIRNSIKVYEGFDDYYKLCSNEDLKDTLNIDSTGNVKINKKIDEYQCTGDEGWFKSGNTSPTNFVGALSGSGLTNIIKMPFGSHNYKSNYFKTSPRLSTSVGIQFYNQTLNIFNAVGISMDINSIPDITAFTNWIKENKPIIQYELAEPYTIDLGQVDISLFENINHINLVDDIETDTRVKYLINTNLNSTYATKSELVIETNKIESSLNQKVSNDDLESSLENLSNSITQEINNKENSILLKVSNDYSTKTETNQAKNEAISSANSSTDSKLTNYATNSSVNASLALKVGKDENNQIVSMLNASANEININGDRFVLNSTNFKVDKTGNITARNGKFTGGELILEDDGTSTNASIKIQTKDTSTGSTITRETTYSGYGIESDIVTNYDYTQEDVQRALNIYTGAITPTQEDYARLDIDKNGEIDIFDASSIQIVVLMRISKDNPGHFSIDTHASFNDNIVITNGLKEKVVSIGLNGVEAIGGDIYYRDGDIYYLDGYVGGGYVTGSGTGFNLGTIFTQKSLGKIESVTLNEGATLTVRQGGKYLVGSATAGASMSLKHCYAQKLGDNAIGVYFNAPSAPTGVTNNDAIGVVMSGLSFTLNGYADEE